MGSKVTEEQLSTVRSIVGTDYLDMDIIRALHMARNDVNKAINIIFDTPSFSAERKPVIVKTKRSEQPNGIQSKNLVVVEEEECDGGASISRSESDEWWLVGCGEVSGLSTSKGKRLKCGDEVKFTFPSKKNSVSPTFGKFGKRRVAAACSEIVRFSTNELGEVIDASAIKAFDFTRIFYEISDIV